MHVIHLGAGHDPLRTRLGRRLPARVGPYVRCSPVTEDWGWERGGAIDRWYIERFLERHERDIRGRVLEVKDNRYTRRFGKGVVVSEVIDNNARNPEATYVADIAACDAIPDGSFDCVIVTQVLQYIADPSSGARHLARILRAGGVALVTAPGIQSIDQAAVDEWRFTEPSLKYILAAGFPLNSIEVSAHGNCFVAGAVLAGLGVRDVRPTELERNDSRYPVLLTARAVAPETGSA